MIDSSYHGTVSSSASDSDGISITDELRYLFQSSDHGQTIACTARQPDGSWVSSYTQLNVVQCKNIIRFQSYPFIQAMRLMSNDEFVYYTIDSSKCPATKLCPRHQQ